MADLSAGDAAPDFDLPGDGGRALRLSDLRGTPVVVYFYPADDTETCTAEAIEFSRLMPRFRAEGIAVIGISPDSPASHDRFKNKHRLSVDLAADESKGAIGAFGVWKEKVLFGREYMGVERTTFLIGGDGRIARIWRKVRTKGHAQAVLAAALALRNAD